MAIPSSEIRNFPTESSKIASKTLIGDLSRETEYINAEILFYSSGSSPEAEKKKAVGYTGPDLTVLREAAVNSFEEAGMEEWHNGLNGGAEGNHQSQVAFEYALEEIGQGAINESKNDIWENQNQWNEVNVITSLPRPAKAMGEKIEEEFGDITDAFPDVEMVVTGGDKMTEPLREGIAEVYDISADKVRNLYAATETGIMAVEDEEGRYKQTNPEIKLEILDKDAELEETRAEGLYKVSEEDVYQLHDIDQEVTGPVLPTVLHEEFPIIRGRIGDVVTAYPTSDGPRMDFEGRVDDVINLAGAMLTPQELEAAVREFNREDEFKAVAAENEDDYVVLNLFLPEEGYVEDVDVVGTLSEYNNSVKSWYREGGAEVEVHTYDSRDELGKMLEEDYTLDRDLLDDFPKSSKIAFDSSFSAR